MSKNTDNKTDPSDPRTVKAALPDQTKGANTAPTDPDHHYKIENELSPHVGGR